MAVWCSDWSYLHNQLESRDCIKVVRLMEIIALGYIIRTVFNDRLIVATPIKS